MDSTYKQYSTYCHFKVFLSMLGIITVAYYRTSTGEVVNVYMGLSEFMFCYKYAIEEGLISKGER